MLLEVDCMIVCSNLEIESNFLLTMANQIRWVDYDRIKIAWYYLCSRFTDECLDDWTEGECIYIFLDAKNPVIFVITTCYTLL